MASFVTEFNHLEIQLEDIILATNNFDESKIIGRGGFGKVYEGELSHSQPGEKSLVAIKRLDRKYGQGDPEFFKEIRMLSCYRHENLISLLGFCSQGGEMILVYEYASRGSLDCYLSSADLTWRQRLRICIDAAKGLCFLHDPNGTQQRVLHCDIKSANILLDKNMTAKVSDFGLSKMGPANQQYSLLITSAVGTPGYCDPLYMQTYSLTKESDVYSFGVVMFEVMCGRLCAEYSNGRLNVYVPFWKKRYEENKLDDIILQDLKQQMDPSSKKTFSDIAYQCLRNAREERPTMFRVVEELEIALDSQEYPDLRLEMLTQHEDILKAVDPLLTYIYKTGKQLKELLSKGLWSSITEKGERNVRIYIQACVAREAHKIGFGELTDCSLYGIVNSRFPGGLCYEYNEPKFKARVRCQYLTPKITYTVNLVFRYYHQDVKSYTRLRYKIDGEDETKNLIIYPIMHERESGWFIAPLYEFTSQDTTADLKFQFADNGADLLIAGIEFQPSEEKVEMQVFEEYQHIVEVASQSLFCTSLDELKQILTIGVHLDGYKTWFSINEKGEHCHMISMKDCLIPNEGSTPRYKCDINQILLKGIYFKRKMGSSQYESHYRSRFPAGFYQTNNKGFETHVKTQLLSPSIIYTVNFVFYASTNADQAYVHLKYRLRGETTTSTVYLANQREDDELHMAELFQFTSDGNIVDLVITFDNPRCNLQVEGILFQPLEIVEDQVSKDDKFENIRNIAESESDAYWEQKCPNDYEEILTLSKDSLMWTTKKELYSILRRGFLINNGQEWFTIDKHGKKCPMLSARAIWVRDDKDSAWESSYESRFGEVSVITDRDKFELVNEIKPELLSADTTYAIYFVYKLPTEESKFEFPLTVISERSIYYKRGEYYSYLVSPPNTPVIGQKFDENSYNPLNRHKLSSLPRHRSDDWMEVKIWGFRTKKTPAIVSMHLKLERPVCTDLGGLIIHGIELRPI